MLGSGRSRVIGVLVPTITNPIFARSTEGIEDIARARNHSTVLMSSGYDPDGEVAMVASLTLERANWVTAALHRDQPTLLAVHHPPFETGIAHMDRLGLRGIDRLSADLHNAPPLAIVGDHVHHTIMGTVAGVPPDLRRPVLRPHPASRRRQRTATAGPRRPHAPAPLASPRLARR